MTDTEVIVVGAGPAGLSRAYWMTRERPAMRLRVLERSHRAGGWLRSEHREGFLLEHGPQSIRSSTEIRELVGSIGAARELRTGSSAAKTRWLGRSGRLIRLPSGPLQVLTTPVLGLRARLRALREPWVRANGNGTGETVAGFVGRRFGDEVVPLVQAGIGGIYAGDVEELEACSVMPRLVQAETEHGSVLRGLRRGRTGPRETLQVSTLAAGIEDLPRRLGHNLGERLQLGCPVQNVTRCGGRWEVQTADETLTCQWLILATPARVSAQILAAESPDLAQQLSAIPFASVASVWLAYPDAEVDERGRGFGFLLDPRDQDPVLGCIYSSSVFPWQAPSGQALFRVMLGGRKHPDVVDDSDQDLIQRARGSLSRYLGLGSSPILTAVSRARHSIPQYVRGHGERMAAVRGLVNALPGLELCGNSYENIAVGPQLARPPEA